MGQGIYSALRECQFLWHSSGWCGTPFPHFKSCRSEEPFSMEDIRFLNIPFYIETVKEFPLLSINNVGMSEC